MAKIRFHQLAAATVLIGFAAWVATGEFSSVGSAAQEPAPEPAAAEQQVEAAPTTVAVVKPEHEMHSRAIRVAGHTEADKRSVLATRTAGIIAELAVDKGDRVEEGDLILKLDAEGKEAAVTTAEQLLAQRKAETEAAEKLAKTGNLPRLQLDQSRSALAQAQSQLEVAQAELERTRVLAPFGGLIDKVPVEQGAAVAQGGEVATLLKLDPIIAVGEISERDIGYVSIGDKADVRLVDDRIVHGKVRYISRDASAQTRTFRIEVAVPNENFEIPAGMTVEIDLAAQPTDSVILPRSVVTLGDKGALGIRAVDKDNKVVFYPIDLVDDTPKGLVLAGIPQDARVIVAGQALVTEGDVVDPVKANPDELKRLVGEASSDSK